MEVLVFVIITSLIMSTILLSAITALRNAPSVHQQWVALQTAKRCMEWYVGQRRQAGFTALTCPSTPIASACVAPSGFAVSTSIACTTWNSDTQFKTITVSVTGAASTTLTTQIGNY